MAQTELLVYCEVDHTAPLNAWLDSLQPKARARCLERLALLEENGHDLRRPHVENLGAGLYELRVKFFQVNYRMLYFFHGRDAVVVTQGFSKEKTIPKREIALALTRKRKFAQDPRKHTFRP
jgi:phage-related protein